MQMKRLDPVARISGCGMGDDSVDNAVPAVVSAVLSGAFALNSAPLAGMPPTERVLDVIGWHARMPPSLFFGSQK